MAKATDKKTLTVILESPDEKKNVVRYDANENDDDPAVRSIYVNKKMLKDVLGNPAKIKVTIEAA